MQPLCHCHAAQGTSVDYTNLCSPQNWSWIRARVQENIRLGELAPTSVMMVTGVYEELTCA